MKFIIYATYDDGIDLTSYAPITCAGTVADSRGEPYMVYEIIIKDISEIMDLMTHFRSRIVIHYDLQNIKSPLSFHAETDLEKYQAAIEIYNGY